MAMPQFRYEPFQEQDHWFNTSRNTLATASSARTLAAQIPAIHNSLT